MGDPNGQYAKDEQDLWIAQATKNVKKSAFFMRKAIDEDNMQEALRQSAAMLSELRTSLLGPQKYYQLYVAVNDELRSLEAFFRDQPSKGLSFADLYRQVQHAGNVLPRLYLLCTVGGCAIRSCTVGAKPLLQDMADLCKGVQHPTRGLFLRAYLVHTCRGLLPDSGSLFAEVEGGGDTLDAIEFLLSNFTEMNKLWVRMKHQRGTRGQDGRERAQLSDLVGKNLTQLSQLEGLTFELYRDVVLPRVLEQVVACKDELAQGYLMQCVVAAFPDDFHVGTLAVLVGALPQLQPGVKLATVMGSLLERLASYASSEPTVVAELDATGAFAKLHAAASAAVAAHPDMPASDLAAVHAGLLSFAGAVYPDRLDYVDDVLAGCHAALITGNAGNAPMDAREERQLTALLTTPLERHGVLMVLTLRHFSPLLGLLSPAKRRDMARRIAEALAKSGDRVGTVESAEILFRLVSPLMEGVPGLELDDEDVAEDAALLAKLVHSLRADDLAVQAQILDIMLKNAIAGGPIRAAAAIPPICFSALQAARQLAGNAATTEASLPCTSCQDWYRFLHRAATALADARAAEMALNMFLEAAQSASQEARLELVAYECFEQAFSLFEEAIPDSRQEVRALRSIVGALQRCRVFGADNRDALVHKATSYCAKLLHRADQCSAVLACAHLHWQQEEGAAGGGENVGGEEGPAGEERAPEAGEEEVESGGKLHAAVHNPKGVLSCLKRALRIAHAAQQQLAVAERRGGVASAPGHLFVEILNAYLYFFDRGVEGVTPEVIQGVVDLVATEVGSDVCREDSGLQNYYQRTLEHVRAQQAAGAELYAGIKAQ